MSRAKRHHHTTQAYLKQFANRDGFVKVYDRLTGKTRSEQLINVAVENNLYTVDDTAGNPSDQYEVGWLQWFDNAIAPVLQKLQEPRPELTNAERSLVSMFLALQHMRTPYMRDFMRNITDLMLRSEVETLMSGAAPEEIEQLIQRWDPNASDREKTRIRQIAADLTQPVPWDAEPWLKAMLRHVPELAEELETREWILLDAEEGAAFLTCDTPVVLGGLYPLRISAAPFIIWPLSPTKLLLLGPPGSFDGYSFKGKLARSAFVRDINQLVAAAAGRWIFWHPDTDAVSSMELPIGPHQSTVNGIPVDPEERYYDFVREHLRPKHDGQRGRMAASLILDRLVAFMGRWRKLSQHERRH
jgi:hypothetical protein